MLNPAWRQAAQVVFIAVWCGILSAGMLCRGPIARAQDTLVAEETTPSAESKTQAPEKVDVAPTARDSDIAARVQRILDATGWFRGSQVRVDEGVVFLSGSARDAEVKEWAGNLARRTQDVVAVVNQMQVERPALWNLEPASEGLRELSRDTIAMLPFIASGIVILIVSWGVARLTVLGARFSLHSYLSSALLRDVLARAVGFLVFLLGIYIVLRVSGLTRLALTVLGGTGILGLVIGIAFRDITENFLASIFLSMRRPFLVGDLVEIVDVLGFVQRLTTRTTVLMTLSGNHVEIPNATVYKSTITNFSTNKNRREDFTIGIAYDVPIAEAQEIALGVLREHPAVLDEPEPWTLVDSLGSSVVVLKVYFWLDGSQHSWLKVKSSIIRLVKRAFQDAGIEMPDEAREIIFPRGVPLERLPTDGQLPGAETPAEPARRKVTGGMPSEPLTTSGEGGLRSEAGEIEDQARRSRHMEGSNLLEDDGETG